MIFRKCGRVVCGNCSASKITYLPSTYVVCPPSQTLLETPHVPHRTCDECFQELDMIRSALRARNSGRSRSNSTRSNQAAITRPPNLARSPLNSPACTYQREDASGRRKGVFGSSPISTNICSASSTKSISSQSVDPLRMRVAEEDVCPFCNAVFRPEVKSEDREVHISYCLKGAEFSGSPSQHRANRMIIYRISEQECRGRNECVVCFEEFKPSSSVARLECLCIYHEKCILDWFSRKGAGECPVHAVH